MPNDPLLEPFQLRHLPLRNRIISTAHAPAFAEDGQPRDRYRLYHEEKAKGGVALTIIGGSTNIAPDSPSAFGQLYAGDDSVVPWFRRLTDGVRSQGAAVMCQITHMGRRTTWDQAHWLPVAGPSGTRERAHRAFPKAMELEDMERIVQQFAEAAVRCQQGGFDGVELLSHSHLLGQFLSPLVNRRDDHYGGSLENRLRLTFEVLAAVRKVVGAEFIVGMRVTGDELKKGGLSADECVKVAQYLEQSGSVDFLNILAGAPYDDLGLAGWVPPMGMPAAAHITVASRIRQAVDLPILHAGGMADVATARHAVSGGHVDLVGMTRAQIADPHLVAKLQRGEEARIRPCVGLGYCVDRVNQGKDAVCGHNAATGREAQLPHCHKKSERRLKAVVVGGGPAGLDAARILAERGHDVTLMEAASALGGQLRLASGSPTRAQVWGVADWLISEVRRLNIDVQLNTFAEEEEVLALSPDVVIVATGGWPEPDEYEGAELALSSWDVLSGEATPAGDVLLLDEGGDQPALVCAEALAQSGCNVELVTPDRTIAHDLGPTNSAVFLKSLAGLGVGFSCFEEIGKIERDGNRKAVTLRHVLTGESRVRTVDHCVVERGLAPNDGLFFALKAKSMNKGQIDHQALVDGGRAFGDVQFGEGFVLARIGDAIAGRNIHAAVLDAVRICKDL